VLRIVCTVVAVGVLASTAVAAPAGRTYEGSGKRTLATFRLTHAATLRWQTSGGFFGGLFALRLMNQRADTPNPQLAFSRARSGKIQLAPGPYSLRVDVLPGTHWQITVG
jgi:hypothetical protein